MSKLTGINDRIAATMTGWVGSMWAVYATLVIVSGWMALATWGPLRMVDPYPFPLMLFLGNVAQLLLCFVILVGQQVLDRVSDERAEQTYKNAEAIFREVSAVREHLMRQDRVLSRGVSLIEREKHPWVRWHGVQPVRRATDALVGVNGCIAAWITKRVGSMWAFYAAVAIQLGWTGLAQVGVIRFDPYPFALLLFLSSLAQLMLMFVIMVGQDVLGLAADQRAEQTHLNAEAILYECGQMREHLTVQDRIISALSEYVRTRVTEQLARAMHESYLEARAARGERMGDRPSLRPWDELAEEFMESNRDQARHAAEKLAWIGCVVLLYSKERGGFSYRPGEVEALARIEHDRWVSERMAQRFVYGPERHDRYHPDLVPWEDLTIEVRDKDARFIRDLPALLNLAGFEIVRIGDARV